MPSRRLLITALSLLASAGLLAPGAPPAGAATRQADAPPRSQWTTTVPGGWFAWGSPVIGDVNNDGANDVVIGGQDGGLYAFDGNGRQLWRGQGTAAIASTPAIADVDGDGRNEVVVGTGSLDSGAYNGSKGAIDIFNSDGSRRCELLTSPAKGPSLVSGAVAIGDVTGDGVPDIVFGAHDTTIYVADGHCGVEATFDNRDSVFSTPALYDVDGTGQMDIFIGGDATENSAVKGDSFNGGIFRRLHFNGTNKLVQIWHHDSTETFQSGAAIGDITGDGVPEVVTGAGAFYCRFHQICGDSNNVWAFNLATGANVPGWPKKAAMNTTFNSAPALGDLDGDGVADVVIGSSGYKANGDLAGGAIDAYYSKTGVHRFYDHSDQDAQQPGSPVIADVDGTPGNEVVYADSGRVDVLSGPTLLPMGYDLGGTTLSHVNGPAVGQIGSTGKWVVVNAGFNNTQMLAGRPAGTVVAYGIDPPTSTPPWPMVGKNAAHLGTEAAEIAPIVCNSGYRLMASDGGVFAFGNAAFFGSTGAIRLNQPIVGGVPTSSDNGYWFVARDGGIFNYGDAKFFGSTGALSLAQPVVGMRATPSGRGYWFVARDGGIFNFGDAEFCGSTARKKLNFPIVAIS
ncbi:MAG TPA: VCBS repeat-containing protein [Acidimicrobiia bacterium]|nr:VCBS repeat-containing protein [Acidimicrobiia bacterium]